MGTTQRGPRCRPSDGGGHRPGERGRGVSAPSEPPLQSPGRPGYADAAVRIGHPDQIRHWCGYDPGLRCCAHRKLWAHPGWGSMGQCGGRCGDVGAIHRGGSVVGPRAMAQNRRHPLCHFPHPVHYGLHMGLWCPFGPSRRPGLLARSARRQAWQPALLLLPADRGAVRIPLIGPGVGGGLRRFEAGYR